MKNTELVKTRQQAKSTERSEGGIDSLTKGSIALMGGISAIIGIWAIAAFVGAVFESGGPFELVKNFFRSIWGM